MKDKKEVRMTISRMVMKSINVEKLYTKEGKEGGLKVTVNVKKAFPKSKFDLTQYYWYLSRNRRQRKLGLPTDRLVVIKDKKGVK